MSITSVSGQLRTTNLAASVRFYTETLGLELAFQYQDFYAGIRAGEQLFHLKHADTLDPSIRFVDEGGHLHLYLGTDDATALAATLERRGVRLIEPVHDTPWGTREFVIHDDQGHTLYFGEAQMEEPRPSGPAPRTGTGPLERAVPILPADDLRRAREFYVERLGFTVLFEATEDGITGLLGVGRGGIELTLDCPMDGHGREACAALRVEDADAWYAEWSDRVGIRRAPKDESWGARTFDVIDPFGNTLFVLGPLPKGRTP